MGQLCSVLPTICMSCCCEKCCYCCLGVGADGTPWKPSQLTTTFFTRVLREAGYLSGPGDEVTGVDVQVFGVGKGLMSVMYRATLEYSASVPSSSSSSSEEKKEEGGASASASAGGGAAAPATKAVTVANPVPLGGGRPVSQKTPPKTLVIKITPPDLKARLIGEALQLFKAEIVFNERNIAAKAGLNCPTCYFAAYTGYGRYLLVLEDLAPAKSGDMMVGGTFEEADKAVSEVAKLHARYRGQTRSSPDTRDWILKCSDETYYKLVVSKFTGALKEVDKSARNVGAPPPTDYMRSVYAASLQNLQLQVEMADVLDASAARWKAGMQRQTLIHGDYRMENMFFTAGPKADEFMMIDFQIMKELPGEQDIYYFIGLSLDTEVRRKHEKKLLRRYFASTMKGAAAVEGCAKYHEGYSMCELLQNFYEGAMGTNAIQVVGLRDAITSSEEARAYMRLVLLRNLAFSEDWQVLNFLQKRRELCWDAEKKTCRPFTEKEMREIILPKQYMDLLDDEAV